MHLVHINQIPIATTCGCWQRRSKKSFVCRFACFHSLSKQWEEFSNISDARCGHRRRSCWYFNYRKCRWSLKITKIGVSPWHALKTRGKILVKFGTSYDDRSLGTRASHKKDHGFQKRKRANSNSSRQ